MRKCGRLCMLLFAVIAWMLPWNAAASEADAAASEPNAGPDIEVPGSEPNAGPDTEVSGPDAEVPGSDGYEPDAEEADTEGAEELSTQLPQLLYDAMTEAMEQAWGEVWEFEPRLCAVSILSETSGQIVYDVKLEIDVRYCVDSPYETWKIRGMCEEVGIDAEKLRGLTQEEMAVYIEAQGYGKEDAEKIASTVRRYANVEERLYISKWSTQSAELLITVDDDTDGELSESTVTVQYYLPEADLKQPLEGIFPDRESLTESGRELAEEWLSDVHKNSEEQEGQNGQEAPVQQEGRNEQEAPVRQEGQTEQEAPAQQENQAGQEASTLQTDPAAGAGHDSRIGWLAAAVCIAGAAVGSGLFVLIRRKRKP